MSVSPLKTLVTFEESLPERASVGCELSVVLDDGTEHLLVADRGFSWRSSEGTDHWLGVTAVDLENDARTCVGPDEPRDGLTQDQAQHDYWSDLADDLRIVRGVTTSAEELSQAPHQVVLDVAVIERTSRQP